MSAITAARTRALALPAALWLGGIVVLSIAARIVLARRIAAPWIMVDEIVYSELGKSFAAHGSFLVRGVPSRGYGIVYPILIAPAWRLFGAMPAVYAAVKAINSVVMSLAAIPAYFLARRLLPVTLSLAVAALALLVPEMLYTGMIMTENVFYPVFLCFALVLVLTLERPTVRRQLLLLALFAVAFESRAQAIALLAAAVTAPLLLALVQGEPLRRGLRPYAALYGITIGGAVAALAEVTARGRSPFTLLGAYNAATSSTYTAGGVARFILYHLADLDLELGIIPFAALLAIWFSARGGGRPRAAFAVASFSIALWLIPEVAAFASQTSVDRIEERNMFYLVPFGLVALVALARDGIVPRRGRAVAAAALIAGVLPVFIPFTSFITTSAVSDTFSMLPWWWVQDHWITIQQVRWAALGVALAGAAVFLFAPRRFAPLLALLVGLYFVGTGAVVLNGRHGIEKASVGSLWAGTHELYPDWIDRAVGRDASVAVLWTDTTTAYPVWEDEFFNRSIDTVWDYDGAPEPDPLPEQPVSRLGSGVLESGGRPVSARYVLADGSVALAGRVVASDPVGFSLYRIDGPVVVLTHVSGLYADSWSGKSVSYQRVECSGGRLAVTLESDPNLFKGLQTVTATEGGRVVGVAHVPPLGEHLLSVPLRAGANGRCEVRFTMARTVVPARVERGSIDTRALGVHFLSFAYARS